MLWIYVREWRNIKKEKEEKEEPEEPNCMCSFSSRVGGGR